MHQRWWRFCSNKEGAACTAAFALTLHPFIGRHTAPRPCLTCQSGCLTYFCFWQVFDLRKPGALEAFKTEVANLQQLSDPMHRHKALPLLRKHTPLESVESNPNLRYAAIITKPVTKPINAGVCHLAICTCQILKCRQPGCKLAWQP